MKPNGKEKKKYKEKTKKVTKNINFVDYLKYLNWVPSKGETDLMKVLIIMLFETKTMKCICKKLNE